MAGDKVWLGFDLGGTKMNAVLFDKKFAVIERRKKKTRGHEGSSSGVDRIINTIEKLLDDASCEPASLAGIGVGCPGPLDLDQGIILEAPNLGWQNVALKDLLQRKFNCPVAICNDVDAGIYGEFRFGAGIGARTVLGVFPGTGIGAGLIYEGKIFRGAKSSCLELGHIPVIPNGAPCGCGRTGCLETVASRLSMSAEIAKAAYRGQAPHILRVAGTDLANIRSGVLSEAIEAGDKIVEQIVRYGASHLGTAIAGTVNLLAPDVIVLGGGLVEALPQIFLDEVDKQLQRAVMPSYAGSYTVKVASLGDDAGAFGCAAWCEFLHAPAA